jgi:hypothetical protein
MEKLLFIMTGINAVGTLLLGITALIKIPKAIRDLELKNETLYRDEALERYEQIKDKLAKAVTLPPIAYGGGDIIVPRLELRKISYNSQTMGDEYRGHKAVVKFYEKADGKIMINRHRPPPPRFTHLQARPQSRLPSPLPAPTRNRLTAASLLTPHCPLLT